MEGVWKWGSNSFLSSPLHLLATNSFTPACHKVASPWNRGGLEQYEPPPQRGLGWSHIWRTILMGIILHAGMHVTWSNVNKLNSKLDLYMQKVAWTTFFDPTQKSGSHLTPLIPWSAVDDWCVLSSHRLGPILRRMALYKFVLIDWLNNKHFATTAEYFS